MYKYYILPLRVFFKRIANKNGAAEETKFSFYFTGVLFGHTIVLLPILFSNISRHYNLGNVEIPLAATLFTANTIAMLTGTYIGKHYAARYALSKEQINNRKLLFIGTVIYFEWVAFLICSLGVGLYFIFNKHN